MNLSDIRLMYNYNHWANEKILAKSAEVTPEQFVAPTNHSWGSLRGTLVHTLDTEYGWRVLCDTSEISFDMNEADFPTIEAVKACWEIETAAWDEYLSRLTDADMNNIIRYTVKEGTRERVLWHCLYHVVNHWMQHHSEAAHMLTQYGQSPGDLDFSQYILTR